MKSSRVNSDTSHKVERYRAGVIPKYAKNAVEIAVKGTETTTLQYLDTQLSRLERVNASITPGSGRRKFVAQVINNSSSENINLFKEVKQKESILISTEHIETQTREQRREQALNHLKQQKTEIVPIYSRPNINNMETIESTESQLIDNECVEFKPIFIKKESRETITNDIEKHTQSSQPITICTLPVEEFSVQAIDDRDIPEESEQDYQAWKIRELLRMTRGMRDEDYSEQTGYGHEQKTKYKFLQRYYHKGAFFMDVQDPIYQRDYDEPTLDDTVIDKTLLPQVMQVKNFGKTGRSKWTHLTAEDTTNFEGPWSRSNPVHDRIKNMQGGLKDIDNHKKHKKS